MLKSQNSASYFTRILSTACAFALFSVILLWMIFAGSTMVFAAPTNYYVDDATGSDSNDGKSLANAFKTINKAAQVMVAGDTCYIRAGTYRETVHPLNNGNQGAPIKFINYNNETVTVTGANRITGSWTHYQNSIYYTSVSLTRGTGNQVFCDGEMVVNARYPNANYYNGTPNLLDRSSCMLADGPSTPPVSAPYYLVDSQLSNLSGIDLTGAKVWFVGGKTGIIGYCPELSTGSGIEGYHNSGE